MGMPKALLSDASGQSLVEVQVEKLRRAAERAPAVLAPEPLVVVGSGAGEVVARLPAYAHPVECPRWARGMGESLRSGLLSVPYHAVAALVMLVDLVDVPAQAIARVAASAGGPGVLVRAAWTGVPGHPVLIGRDHLPAAIAASHDDVGARELLRPGGSRAGHEVRFIECGDLVPADGDGAIDMDTPAQAAARGFHLPTEKGGKRR